MKTELEIQDELYLAFDDYLDEVLPIVKIGFLEYTASQVLKAVDPIAYEVEFSDWTSTFEE